MAVSRLYDFKIDFVRNRIFGSAAWYFVIILKLILTPGFEIKSREKIPWHQKISMFYSLRKSFCLKILKFFSIKLLENILLML